MRRLTAVLLGLGALGAGAAVPDAAAQGAGDANRAEAAAERYADCMALARGDPDAALGRARRWRDTGGGAPARHCEGVALMNLGHYGESARLLERLARALPAGTAPGLRADALAQAGQAWLLDGNPEAAAARYGAALDLDPDDVELWIDRALARFEAGRPWEAIDDLNRASELAPKRADIFVFRASAYRHVEAPELAREDIERALALDPDHLEGLLERGILHRLAGREDAARQDWLKVIDRAPDSPAAISARENLERMDLQMDDAAP